ncbi:MAG: hypothetical protein AAFR59_02470, partial [Bacteroidota bacterium]
KNLPYSLEVERQDPLNRYSSIQYGHNFQVPVAVAANARYEEMGATSFEFPEAVQNRCGQHVFFTAKTSSGEDARVQLVDTVSHTGLRAARLPLSHDALRLKTVMRSTDSPVDQPDQIPFILDESDCVGALAPDSGKYVIGFWVKSETYFFSADPLFSYQDVDLKVQVDGAVITPEMVRKSNLIEGWQRCEYVVDLPFGSELIIDIERVAGSDILYVDDFRLHPYLSQMETYVYDPGNLRLLAKCDINNYSTFYQYDHSGALSSVKRETARGIQTLQEVRAGQSKLLP